MSSGLHVVRAGAGPHILLIHGSATDHRTWSIQLASPLRGQFTLIAYDRRADAPSVEAHADDAEAVLAAEAASAKARADHAEAVLAAAPASVDARAGHAEAVLAAAPAPAVVIGSSFGAVIALDLIRRRAVPLAGAILIEPPLAASDTTAAVRDSFLPAFDHRAARDGGPAAAELFLRIVLGDAAFERLPRAFQTAAMMKFAEIRADTVAVMAYRPRYTELAAITTPVLLLGGERSASTYRPTLEALHAALGNARLEILAGAGHMLHADAPRKFHALVAEFAGRALGDLARRG